MSSKRGSWSSNLGFIIATAGSAIGLGNIWKFPAKAANGGGGAFIIIYFAIIFTLGASLMLTEMTLGRHTQKNAVDAFGSINSKWNFVGYLGIIAAFIVLSYYGVVGGWVIKYITVYLSGADFRGDAVSYYFNFIESPISPIVFQFIFMVITTVIVIRGISGGIEKANKYLMPALLLLLLILLFRALTLPDAMRGVNFLTSFDFSKMTPEILLSALGQALFSLSIGLGTTCTYASYLSKKENLVSNTGIVCLLDTLIATLAAFIIIPAVFSSNIPLGEGGSFAFTALPSVFSTMPFGNFCGASFFVLLSFAAITSAISLLEAIVAFLIERLSLSRTKAAIYASSAMFLVGILYSLSKGAFNLHGFWYTVKSGLTYPILGDALERVCDYLLIPLGSLGFCLFVGHVWGADNAIDEIEQGKNFALKKLWATMVRYIAPLTIGIIMILGFFGEIKL